MPATATLATARMSAAPAAQSFARLASGWMSGDARSTTASMAVLTAFGGKYRTDADDDGGPSPQRHLQQGAQSQGARCRRYVHFEVALARRRDNALRGVAKRLEKLVLRLQIESARPSFAHSTHSTTSPGKVCAGAAIVW